VNGFALVKYAERFEKQKCRLSSIAQAAFFYGTTVGLSQATRPSLGMDAKIPIRNPPIFSRQSSAGID